jgi:hypothetical protein
MRAVPMPPYAVIAMLHVADVVQPGSHHQRRRAAALCGRRSALQGMLDLVDAVAVDQLATGIEETQDLGQRGLSVGRVHGVRWGSVSDGGFARPCDPLQRFFIANMYTLNACGGAARMISRHYQGNE